jgi:hypothetical protein
MGRGDLATFLQFDDVECPVVCDVDDRMLAEAVALVEKRRNRAPDPVKDFRRLLERRDVDAVVVATPDHWHALPTILAFEAGKDVEKPLATTIAEGRAMATAVAAVRRRPTDDPRLGLILRVSADEGVVCLNPGITGWSRSDSVSAERPGDDLARRGASEFRDPDIPESDDRVAFVVLESDIAAGRTGGLLEIDHLHAVEDDLNALAFDEDPRLVPFAGRTGHVLAGRHDVVEAAGGAFGRGPAVVGQDLHFVAGEGGVFSRAERRRRRYCPGWCIRGRG